MDSIAKRRDRARSILKKYKKVQQNKDEMKSKLMEDEQKKLQKKLLSRLPTPTEEKYIIENNINNQIRVILKPPQTE